MHYLRISANSPAIVPLENANAPLEPHLWVTFSSPWASSIIFDKNMGWSQGLSAASIKKCTGLACKKWGRRERERQSVCLCVCVWEREREREKIAAAVATHPQPAALALLAAGLWRWSPQLLLQQQNPNWNLLETVGVTIMCPLTPWSCRIILSLSIVPPVRPMAVPRTSLVDLVSREWTRWMSSPARCPKTFCMERFCFEPAPPNYSK